MCPSVFAGMMNKIVAFALQQSATKFELAAAVALWHLPPVPSLFGRLDD